MELNRGSKSEEILPELDIEPSSELTEIESLCMQCRNDGITKLLLTKIPFYKEVVVMSFSCDHCNWQNCELQPAATIQEKGVVYKLRICSVKDLSRQIVKTKHASVTIPELNFEIPSGTQEGDVTNIESILTRAYEGIKSKQEELQETDPVSSEKLEVFLKDLHALQECKSPFHLILRDSSGNSFLENLCAPKNDPEMEISYFERTREEALHLGIVPPDCDTDDSLNEGEKDFKNEVLEFPTNCSNCNAPCITNMKLTNLPLFKDVVIMATVCEACGHRTNEVKSGGGIEDQGVRYELKLKNEKDLNRDLLKSDTCKVYIPELELDIGATALNGCYTTVEGLVKSIKKQLVEDNPMINGDSAPRHLKKKMKAFSEKLDQITDMTFPCTIILDDPCGNSYLQSLDQEGSDSNLISNRYKRTFDQDEDLGLNDMKIENYEEN